MLHFETIKLLDGTLQNMPYHNARFHRTLAALYGVHHTAPKLEDSILIPTDCSDGIFKVKVIYNNKIVATEISLYEISLHKTILIEESPLLVYNYKNVDRSIFAIPTGFDDVIYTQNGLLTDSTFCNLALFDGEHWHTPSTYLLEGTKLAVLISQEILRPKKIHIEDLNSYQKIAFINAMRDFELVYHFSLEGHTLHLELIS